MYGQAKCCPDNPTNPFIGIMIARQITRWLVVSVRKRPASTSIVVVGAAAFAGYCCLSLVVEVKRRRSSDYYQHGEHEDQRLQAGKNIRGTGAGIGERVTDDPGEATTTTTTTTSRPMSYEEARVRAMVENARKSSWRQNLSNAIEAQERFMQPPGRAPSTQRTENSKFVNRIDRRAEQMILKQHQQAEYREQQPREEEERDPSLSVRRRTTTRFWK